MDAFLNKGIKEIIDEHPDVEKILDEYGIGCGPCSVGICQLKDIVDIHNLPEDQERELMHKIAGIISPDSEIDIPEGRKKNSAVTDDIHFSPLRLTSLLRNLSRSIRRWDSHPINI